MPQPRGQDGGWAWVMLGACSVCVMVTSGFAILAGIFQPIFLEELGQGVVITSWITSLYSSLMQMAGPLSGAVCSVFGCRASVMAGAILLTSGLLMSSFSRDVTALLFAFGISCGLGLGLIYSAAIVQVNLCFTRYRPLATGVVMAGGGVGIMTVPPLCRWLLALHSCWHTLLLLACLAAQLVPAGALLFSQEAGRSKTSSSSSSSSSSSQAAGVLPVVAAASSSAAPSGSSSSSASSSSLQEEASCRRRRFSRGKKGVSHGEADALCEVLPIMADSALHEASTAKEIDHMEPVSSSRTSVNRSSSFEESDPMASTSLPRSSFSKASTAKEIKNTCSEKPSTSAFCRSTANEEVNHSSSSVNASRTSLRKDYTTEEIGQMSSASLSEKHLFSRDSINGDTDHLLLASCPCLLTTVAADDEVRNGACTHAHSPGPVPVGGHDPLQGGDPAVDTNTSSLKMTASEPNVHGHSTGAAHISDLQGAQHPSDTRRSSELYSQDTVLILDVTARDSTKDVEFVSGGKAKDMVSHSEDVGKAATQNSEDITKAAKQNSEDDGKATTQNSDVLYGGNATDAEAAVLMIPTRELTRAERLKVDAGESVKTFVKNMASVVSCPSILLLCLQLVLSSAGIGIILVHYINFCLSMGSTFDDVSLGFSANGFALTVARFMLGVLAQDTHIDPLCVYVGMALVTSLTLMLMPVVAVTASLQILSLAVLGVYAGASYVLLTEITIHCAGLDTLSLTFGLEMVAAGLGYLVAPPTAGWLVVWTGSYSNAIFLAGVLYLMSAVVAMLLSLTRPKWSPERSSSLEKDVKTPDDVTDTS